jgi:hypothetical protein
MDEYFSAEHYDDGYSADAAIDEIELIARDSGITISDAYDIWFERGGYGYPVGVIEDIFEELDL